VEHSHGGLAPEVVVQAESGGGWGVEVVGVRVGAAVHTGVAGLGDAAAAGGVGGGGAALVDEVQGDAGG